ncbi:sensor histidine kinase, partial [Nostoc sp. UCD121]|uniref:ATP-binding protein n=1 Tax=Nostoc sp. UCD121 TaxID=2681305 RepID=UPI0016286867
YNPDKSILKVSATVEHNMIRCYIQDNSMVMSQQECEQLFNVDFDSNLTHDSLISGLIGLHFCRQIITAHNGRIGVNTSPRDGLTFWFTLSLENIR